MGKRRIKQSPPPRRLRWWWAAFGVVALVAAGVGAFWWFSEAQDSSGGTPRLLVDRTEVDLGYLRFEAPARAVFTLTNAGDGLFRLVEVPLVKVLKGC